MKDCAKNDVSWIRGALALAFITIVTAGGATTYLPIEATNWPGMQPSLDTSPKPAAPLAPAASPTPSSGVASPGVSSPAATPPPEVPTGPGVSIGGGTTVKAGGAFATEVDAGGNAFTGAITANRGAWSARAGVTGGGPVSARGVASGPSPVLIDATIQIFHLPISVRGTPGTDLNVSVGTPSSTVLDQARPVASVHPSVVLADSPAQVAGQIVESFIRTTVAFTLVGWLLLIIAPGLRARSNTAMQSSPFFRRLGLGAILALDVPLAALLLAILGVPFGLWWIGLVALAIFVAVAVAGYAFTGFQIGVLLLGRSDGVRSSWLLEVPVGVALLVLAGQIPYVGAIVSIVAVIYGIGSMLYAPAEPKQALVPSEGTTFVPASPQKPLVE